MPTVSVIVPLYNKRTTIARTLKSVYAQEYRDFEVIVVDDGSTDGSTHVVEQLALPNLRVVSQENAGPGAARNRGARMSNAEFLAFIDADDEWLPSYLGRMVSILESDDDLACVTSGYFEHPSGRDLGPEWRAEGLEDGIVVLTDVGDAAKVLALLRFMQPLTTVIRRSRFLTLGGYFDGWRCLYGEDSHLFLKLLLSHRVLVTLDPLARYHREDSDLSVSDTGPRPVEPFLHEPSDVREVCPPHLGELLESVLEARANKTACMLGYWGLWREAGRVRRRFGRRNLIAPLALPAMLAGTPVGPLAGSTVRWVRRVFQP